MARQDPEDAQTQADIANGHFEIGTMLMTGKRYEEAEGQFHEAFERYSRIAAADTLNIDVQVALARCAHRASDAGVELARMSSSGALAKWRERAVDWTRRSLDLYTALETRGALSGDDVAAPREVAARLVELRTQP
jgi:hypothetical protein